MANSEIKSGVLIKLKDDFSRNIGKCAGAAKEFAGKTIGALDKVNSALSGTAAKFGALGVSLSIGAAGKWAIDLDEKLTRIGINANASSEQVGRLKQTLFKAARAAKVSVKDLEAFAGALAANAISIDDIIAGAPYAATAIQALGISGEEFGEIYATLRNRGLGTGAIAAELNNLAAVSDKVSGVSLQEFIKRLPDLTTKSGASSQNLHEMYIQISALAQGTKNARSAMDEYASFYDRLNDSDIQKKMNQRGIKVKENGELRAFDDILKDIIALKNKTGKDFERIGDAFGLNQSDIHLLKQYELYYQETIDKVGELGDTEQALAAKADAAAASLAANLKDLQTAFYQFADTNLSEPLAQLTALLNKLAEDPKRIEATFRAIKRGLLIVGGVKIGAGALSLVSSIKNLRGGGANIPGKTTATASAASPMPVFVTNWGGASGGGLIAAPQSAGGSVLLDQHGKPIGASAAKPEAKGGTPKPNKGGFKKPNTKVAVGGGLAAAALGAVFSVPGMVGEMKEISGNEELNKEEKSKARGGAIGEAAGSIGGMAAGALIGAAAGSIIPGPGTAVGMVVGGVIGLLGGPAGRLIGEKIGAAAGKEKEAKNIPPSAPSAPPAYSVTDFGIPISDMPLAVADYMPYTPELQNMKLDGAITLQSQLVIDDSGYKLNQRVVKNTTPFQFPAGHSPDARLLP